MSAESGITLGVLLRTGHSCDRVRQELASSDAAGIARAREGFNNTLSLLGGMLDDDTRRELSVLCPPVPLEQSPISLGLAYAGLTGWIEGLLSGVRLLSTLSDEPDVSSPGPAPRGYL